MKSLQQPYFPAFDNIEEFPTASILSYDDRNGNTILQEFQRNAFYLSRKMSPHFIQKIEVSIMRLYTNMI